VSYALYNIHIGPTWWPWHGTDSSTFCDQCKAYNCHRRQKLHRWRSRSVVCHPCEQKILVDVALSGFLSGCSFHNMSIASLSLLVSSEIGKRATWDSGIVKQIYQMHLDPTNYIFGWARPPLSKKSHHLAYNIKPENKGVDKDIVRHQTVICQSLVNCCLTYCQAQTTSFY
jgi:hypothetical protein